MAVSTMDMSMDVDPPGDLRDAVTAAAAVNPAALVPLQIGDRPEDTAMGTLPLSGDAAGGPQSEWRYEMRRDAQEIVPGVILGPLQVAKDLEHLKRLGITHVVCVRDAAEAAFVRPRFPTEFLYLVLDVRDREDEMVIRLLASSREFINNAIVSGGRVFIHCGSGISLSPTLVIAYLMQQYQASYEAALNYLQQRRYCVNPNPGFANQLRGFEAIYKAQLAIAMEAAAAVSAPDRDRRPSAARKRSNEDVEEDDEPDVDAHRPVRGISART